MLSKTRKEAPSYTQPAENLLIIVADIQRHLNDDVYRYPYPTDVTGQNAFRAAIVRLQNYQTLYPGKLADAVALAKAQAYEKLTAYKEAGNNYELAKASEDEAIRKLANEGFERTKRFSEVADMTLDQSGLRTYERDMQKKIKDFEKLADDYKKTPYQCLAFVERERAQMQLAEFYIKFRFIQPFSLKDATNQLTHNIDDNKNSKNLFAHNLMLGDLNYDLAKEYVLLNDPEGPNFSQKAFDGFANGARTQYHIVEQADGFAEKLEARAKMAALEAFVERITDRGR